MFVDSRRCFSAIFTVHTATFGLSRGARSPYKPSRVYQYNRPDQPLRRDSVRMIGPKKRRDFFLRYDFGRDRLIESKP